MRAAARLRADAVGGLRTTALVAGASALAGVPAGLVWWLLAPLPLIEKRSDGLYRAGLEGNESAIAADGWLALIGVALGVLVALGVYLRTRPGRVGPLLGVTIGGVLGALVAWRTGHLLGPDAIRVTARTVPVGTRFDGPLDVSAYGVLLTWPMAAVITYFAVAAGAEGADEDEAAGRPAGEATERTVDLPADRADAGVSPADGSAPSGPR